MLWALICRIESLWQHWTLNKERLTLSVTSVTNAASSVWLPSPHIVGRTARYHDLDDWRSSFFLLFSQFSPMFLTFICVTNSNEWTEWKANCRPVQLFDLFFWCSQCSWEDFLVWQCTVKLAGLLQSCCHESLFCLKHCLGGFYGAKYIQPQNASIFLEEYTAVAWSKRFTWNVCDFNVDLCIIFCLYLNCCHIKSNLNITSDFTQEREMYPCVFWNNAESKQH